MKNSYKIYFLSIILLTALVGCVQTVENPLANGGTNVGNKPVINVLSPVSDDSLRMGNTPVDYQASDYQGGPGLLRYKIFVEGVLIQSFEQKKNGSNPLIYFSSDSLEAKLGINPADWPTQISYAITVINKDGDFSVAPAKDSTYTIMVDKRPIAPHNLTLTRLSDKSFNLFWDDLSSNEIKYEIWRQDGLNNTFVRIKELVANTISSNDFVKSDYINYGYKVRAVNGFGSSDFSNIVYSNGIPGGDAPTDLKGEALGASTIQLTWKDNTDTEDGFVIERTNPQTGNFKRLVILPRNTEEYFDTDLSPLTTYEYKVASFKSSSISLFSKIVSVATYGDDVPAPSNLIANYKPVAKAVIVKWDDNTFLENGTIIERKETINGKFKQLGTTAADINTFSDNDIVENQFYYYRARFTTTEGVKTKYSNIDTAYVYDAPPTEPTNLQITKFSDTDYSLWWEDNSNDEEGFELWRKTGSDGTYVLYKELRPNTKSYNDVVAKGVVYYYKVRAFRNPTFSNFSNEVNTENANGSEFPTPSSLSYQIVNTKQVKLNWANNATDETQIIVERKLQLETEYKVIKRLSPGTTTWTDKDGLSQNLTIYYRLKTKYSQGDSEYTTVLTVYIP